MRMWLLAAACYNIAWGAYVSLLPEHSFKLFNLPEPFNPVIWQSMGMVIGCYGIAYFLAAKDAVKFWPIVFVGLLGKVLGPLGYLFYALQGKYPWEAGYVHITNDLIWWIPFILILKKAYDGRMATNNN